MAIISIVIDDFSPSSELEAIVNFRWFAVDDARGRSATDSGSLVMPIDALNSKMNQQVIDECVLQAGKQGVTLTEQDRKLLLAGLA
jgi:hypothetical protein